MDDLELIKKRIEESIDAKKEFLKEVENIKKAGNAIVYSLKKGGKILIFGNGGSAADSQHIAGELVAKFLIERKGIPAIALTTDSSILTAWSNDYPEGFENVFARQVEALACRGDVLIGISTSGNSENVIRALKKGRESGTVNISLTGRDGGKIKAMSDYNINSSSDSTPRIQECHEVAYHIICEIVEREMSE